jgi:hypothetical protein
MARKSRYIAAFSLSILIFFLGIFLGNLISNSQISILEENELNLRTELISLELKDKMIEKTFSCNLSWESVWKEKVEMGQTISSLEARFGKNNEKVLIQKELYELIEIRTFLLLTKIKEECNAPFSIILFFYTNDKNLPQELTNSENQGYVLDSVYASYPLKVNILSFDSAIKNVAVDSLIETYNVKTYPSIVIDGKLYEGFFELDELKEILGLD